MINEAKKKTIDDIFAEGTLIDSALKLAGEKALWKHKKLGNPRILLIAPHGHFVESKTPDNSNINRIHPLK
jgi:hypothetical protein